MRRITEFEAVRGMMAIWVMLGHTCAAMILRLPEPVPQNLSGRTAVDVFIILSGFVIALLLVEKGESYRVFVTRRFFRLAPVYLLCLAVSTAMLGFAAEALGMAPETAATAKRLSLIGLAQENLWENVLAHATMLHGLATRLLPSAAYTIIGQAWSVSVEWQFYIMAPFVIATFWSRDLRSAAVLFVGLVALRVIGGDNGGVATSHAGLFAVGIFYYHLWSTLTQKDRGWPLSRIRALSLSLLIVGYFVTKSPIAIILWVGFTHLAFTRVLVQSDTGPERLFGRLLTWRPLAYLGKISYSVYLTHMIVLYPALYLSSGLEPVPQAAALLLGVTAGTLALSSATYYWVEKPGIQLGNAVANNWRSRRSPSSLDSVDTARS